MEGTTTIEQQREAEIVKFLSDNNFKSVVRQSITPDASHRKYERIIDKSGANNHLGGKSFILMNDNATHNNLASFIKISDFLRSIGLSSPVVYFADEKKGLALTEDFRLDSFSLIFAGASILSKNHKVERKVYMHSIAAITRMQRAKIDIELELFSKDMLIEELDIFINWYFRYKAIILTKLQKETFYSIWNDLLDSIRIKDSFFVHRDFHADNLLWLPKREGIRKVGMLDFQDAVLGSPTYDLVSLLEDARVDVVDEVSQYIINHFLDNNKKFQEEDFMYDYSVFGVQRNLKILGIFTRLNATGKEKYISMLERIWRYISIHIKKEHFSELRKWINEVLAGDSKRNNL